MQVTEQTKPVDYDPKYRNVTIKTIDGSIMMGCINISTYQRVSEMFTNGKENPFLVVTEAGFGEVSRKTLVINKSHIVWVEPEE